MKKGNLSKYCKLAAILLYNVIPVWYLISISFAKNTDFAAIGFLIGIVLLIVFNLWAVLVYKLTKKIQKPVLREFLFYFLLFLFLYPVALDVLISLFFGY